MFFHGAIPRPHLQYRTHDELSVKHENGKTRVKECRQHQDASRPSSSGRGVPLMPVQSVYCRLGESALTRVLLCGASVAVYEGSNKGTTLGQGVQCTITVRHAPSRLLVLLRNRKERCRNPVHHESRL